MAATSAHVAQHHHHHHGRSASGSGTLLTASIVDLCETVHNNNNSKNSSKKGRRRGRLYANSPFLPSTTEEETMEAVKSRDSTNTTSTEASSLGSLFSGTSFASEASDDCRPDAPPLIHTLFEELTETWQYVVADPITRHAVIIDPHLDNPPASTNISTIAADRVLSVVAQNRYFVDRILHTHEPRDHPSSAWYLRAQLLQTTGVAPRITTGKTMQAIQRVFKRKYSMNDGSQWKTDFEDGRFTDGQQFAIGTLKATALHFPGGQYAFVIGHHIFAGTSQFNLEVRARHDTLLGDLRKYKIYTIQDDPPQRKASLVPMYGGSGGSSGAKGKLEKQKSGRKLVIRYAAEDLPALAELPG